MDDEYSDFEFSSLEEDTANPMVDDFGLEEINTREEQSNLAPAASEVEESAKDSAEEYSDFEFSDLEEDAAANPMADDLGFEEINTLEEQSNLVPVAAEVETNVAASTQEVRQKVAAEEHTELADILRQGKQEDRSKEIRDLEQDAPGAEKPDENEVEEMGGFGFEEINTRAEKCNSPPLVFDSSVSPSTSPLSRPETPLPPATPLPKTMEEAVGLTPKKKSPPSSGRRAVQHSKMKSLNRKTKSRLAAQPMVVAKKTSSRRNPAARGEGSTANARLDRARFFRSLASKPKKPVAPVAAQRPRRQVKLMRLDTEKVTKARAGHRDSDSLALENKIHEERAAAFQTNAIIDAARWQAEKAAAEAVLWRIQKEREERADRVELSQHLQIDLDKMTKAKREFIQNLNNSAEVRARKDRKLASARHEAMALAAQNVLARVKREQDARKKEQDQAEREEVLRKKREEVIREKRRKEEEALLSARRQKEKEDAEHVLRTIEREWREKKKQLEALARKLAEEAKERDVRKVAAEEVLKRVQFERQEKRQFQVTNAGSEVVPAVEDLLVYSHGSKLQHIDFVALKARNKHNGANAHEFVNFSLSGTKPLKEEEMEPAVETQSFEEPATGEELRGQNKAEVQSLAQRTTRKPVNRLQDSIEHSDEDADKSSTMQETADSVNASEQELLLANTKRKHEKATFTRCQCKYCGVETVVSSFGVIMGCENEEKWWRGDHEVVCLGDKCPKRCYGCNGSFPRDELETHMNSCSKLAIKCFFKQDCEPVLRANIYTHLEQHSFDELTTPSKPSLEPACCSYCGLLADPAALMEQSDFQGDKDDDVSAGCSHLISPGPYSLALVPHIGEKRNLHPHVMYKCGFMGPSFAHWQPAELLQRVGSETETASCNLAKDGEHGEYSLQLQHTRLPFGEKRENMNFLDKLTDTLSASPRLLTGIDLSFTSWGHQLLSRLKMNSCLKTLVIVSVGLNAVAAKALATIISNAGKSSSSWPSLKHVDMRFNPGLSVQSARLVVEAAFKSKLETLSQIPIHNLKELEGASDPAIGHQVSTESLRQQHGDSGEGGAAHGTLKIEGDMKKEGTVENPKNRKTLESAKNNDHGSVEHKRETELLELAGVEIVEALLLAKLLRINKKLPRLSVNGFQTFDVTDWILNTKIRIGDLLPNNPTKWGGAGYLGILMIEALEMGVENGTRYEVLDLAPLRCPNLLALPAALRLQDRLSKVLTQMSFLTSLSMNADSVVLGVLPSILSGALPVPSSIPIGSRLPNLKQLRLLISRPDSLSPAFAADIFCALCNNESLSEVQLEHNGASRRLSTCKTMHKQEGTQELESIFSILNGLEKKLPLTSLFASCTPLLQPLASHFFNGKKLLFRIQENLEQKTWFQGLAKRISKTLPAVSNLNLKAFYHPSRALQPFLEQFSGPFGSKMSLLEQLPLRRLSVGFLPDQIVGESKGVLEAMPARAVLHRLSLCLKDHPTLTSLDISRCMRPREGMLDELLPIWKENTHIEELNISHNAISEAEFCSFCDGWSENQGSKLRILDLRKCMDRLPWDVSATFKNLCIKLEICRCGPKRGKGQLSIIPRDVLARGFKQIRQALLGKEHVPHNSTKQKREQLSEDENPPICTKASSSSYFVSRIPAPSSLGAFSSGTARTSLRARATVTDMESLNNISEKLQITSMLLQKAQKNLKDAKTKLREAKLRGEDKDELEILRDDVDDALEAKKDALADKQHLLELRKAFAAAVIAGKWGNQ